MATQSTDLIDIHSADISGDGSTLVCGAAENGKSSCQCRARKIYRCDCPKYYSDRSAQWGYDSYRDVYFFGHRFYQLTASDSGHDLPLTLTIAPANESDYTLSIKTLDRFLKSNPDMSIRSCTLDAGHDSIAHYEYLEKKNILPVIALNPRTPLEFPDKTLSEKGIPLCPAGVEMSYHHRDKTRKRQYYHCPAKKKTRVKGKLTFTPKLKSVPGALSVNPIP